MKKERIITGLIAALFVHSLWAAPTNYIVKEDAYLRNGSNAAKNYNYENITSAHGAQYDGKGYKVINAKYQGSNEIIGVMKFDLPAPAEIAASEYNKFEFQFSIFKNADYNTGDQDYVFRYTTDTSWSETTITWNNRPATLDRTNTDILFTFHIDKGDEYETKSDAEKTITRDITETIEALVAAGHTELTVFVTASASLNTSLMLHCKETSVEAKRPRIIASKAEIEAENIAYKKPARSNLSKSQVVNVNDGDVSTSWSGVFFPAYVDIDLMDTYNIEKIALYFPSEKKSYYTLYGSNDGKNYDKIYQTRSAETTPAEGRQVVFAEPKAYRIVRVYIEFTDGDNKAYLSEVKVYGTTTNTNIGALRQGSLEDVLGVLAYDDPQTVYSRPITTVETIENVYGIIDRTIGAEYRNWFTFELADKDSENDYFELSDADGKIHIRGNKGLSLTTGLNYYFKNYVGVHISEQTMQVKMPAQLVPIGATVRKETPFKVRYAFNYCTLNYTFSFFGEENWQRENDWLALNGVNVVLDLAGQEATWIKFLMNFGYSFDEAKNWLTGPSYYAWQFMDNMESFGGPIPDGYVKDRLELARSAQRWKTSLGMQTVLQGYAGMVPTNFNEYQPYVSVVQQGNWNGFSRPYMIATDSPQYDDYARKFYQAQEFVFGKTSNYYAVDPFHEGGIRPSGLTDDKISKEVLESLLEYDKNAVWIVQGWQSNPTNALLNGMAENRTKHVLIVDLIKYPIKSWTKYNKLKYDNTTLDALEFNGTNWAWCLLANFGGNPSMHGQMDVMVEDILTAKRTSAHMQGIGIISEAMYDNPVLYDLIFDLVWADSSFDPNQWMDKYIQRRYGAISENARLAWKIMRNSNYNHGVRYTNELFGMKGKAPQDYGAQDIPYVAENLETAFKLLAGDYEKFKNSECYRYDLTEIMRQVVSNYALLTYNAVLTAKANNSLEEFKSKKKDFLNAFDILNVVQATQKEQLGGEWIGKALDLAANYDDFSKTIFEMNAKTLITTWGSRGSSSLKDYGWRNYEGIFLDVYKTIWKEYLDKVEKNLTDGTPVQTISASEYFNFYWNWIMSSQSYTRNVKNSPEELKEVIDIVIAKSSLTDGLDPNAGNLALNRTAKANTGSITGKASAATDGSVNTQVGITASTAEGQLIYPEITVDLLGEFQLSKLNLVLDNTDNTFYQYEVYASSDSQNWEKIAEKKTDKLHAAGGDTLLIGNNVAKFVKVVGTLDSKHLAAPAETTLTVKEIRVYGERVLPSLEQLERLLHAVSELNFASNTETQIERVEELAQIAQSAFDNAASPDEVNTVYWNLYDYVVSLDVSGLVNIANGKTVTAHNDPSGNSQNLNDGDTGTYWDSGRLSPVGLPYEDAITPGWAIIDLAGVYHIDELKLKFAKSAIWHKYEIYSSLDNQSWNKIAEKTSATNPNEAEDTHSIDVEARYIKMLTTDIQLESGGKRNPYHMSELEVYGTPTSVQ
ncbi:MAG: alpha-N-acetylglucosaminidase C-terminal domain-containing protein [Prevotella sp.]|jgi:hypothetical protein|nr:alpha-N-acetylglucosaminidase C-terminal domain-containing protein [Prevotella sp.]